MRANDRLVDDLAQVIRDSRLVQGQGSWFELGNDGRNIYRKQARAVLDFLARLEEEDEEPIPPAQMPLEQLAELIYDAYNRHYGGPGPALSTQSPAKRGPYLAMAQAVIDAGQAPKVTVDWREMLSAATVPTFIQVPAPATVTASNTPAKKPLPEGIKEFAWIGRFSEGFRFFSTEEIAATWMRANRSAGAKLHKIRIDWAQPYDLRLVPADE